MAVQLGPFVLEKKIGQGGMGEVWRARHGTTGLPVALKLLKRAGGWNPDTAELDARAFANELRAIARLAHPSVCTLLDHGVVDPRAHRDSGGALPVAAPYLVMELVPGGSLDAITRPLTWGELRAVLLAVLDALAHAHAGRVLHRDVKAGNVLLMDANDPSAGLKLTDFGIALGLEDETGGDAEEHVAGTLHYMPPEQLIGEWRDFGPWTDLYATGCMAYKLATGHTPFHGLKGKDLVRAHFQTAPPPVVARGAISPAFGAWVALLLRKDRWARFRAAADAAAALRDLPPPHSHAAARGRAVADDATAILRPDAITTLAPVAPAAPIARAPEHVEPPPSAPVPATWRHPLPPAPSPALVHAGLALFGLRTVQFVGREAERDRLWGDLVTVARTGRPRVVVIRGPSGIGKSRLAEWFADRACEVGAALVHRVTAGPFEAGVEGLARLVRRAVTAVNTAPNVARERIASWEEATRRDREPLDVEALLDLVAPGHAQVQLDSFAERHQVVLAVLQRLTAERAGIVLVDDAAWSPDALALAARCLTSTERLPLLFVAVASDEAAAEQPETSRALDALAASPGARVEHLGPLERSERTDLLRALLAMEPGLAARIEDRSAGSPLLAVQIVSDLVSRESLVLDELGRFRLAEGRVVDLPDDLQVMWTRAIDRATTGLPLRGAVARQALWRAAALGMDVHLGTWSAVCEDPANPTAMTRDGLRLRTALLDRLVGMRLAEDTDEGFRFANGTLREALLREAREAGQLQGIHADCAQVIANLSGPGVAERLGRHLLAAGRLADALTPLWEGLRARERSEGPRVALALLDDYLGALEELGIDEADPRWTTSYVRRADLLRLSGDFEGSLPWFERGLASARAHGHSKVSALFLMSATLWQMGRQESRALILEWAEEARLSRDPVALGKYHYHMGSGYGRANERRDRVAHLTLALDLLREVGDRRGEASCLRNLAMEASLGGDEATSLALNAEALKIFEELGLRSLIALCANGFGESYRRLGRLAEAEREYQRALTLWRALGDAEQLFPLLNLGILAAETGRMQLALGRFEEARLLADRQGRRHLHAMAGVLSLVPLAGLQDANRYDDRLLAAESLRVDGYADRDVAIALDRAAELAAKAGWSARAKRTRVYADDMWQGLGGRPADGA